ncbi:restriction modification system DNA specificity domain [Alkaliphilus metalliredigens QYMF]|uniref:Restriction modification system DNA specificity domain n=1 Tax=Alkaliphilus metalliredigens (strain QYMF) TaxID=293826 RepID=A6TVC1_ALKMQ|nr:restriction endonuclease subunit S [Alkaliphilus metalliredigens]ABR50139.1 restriction modification system DNA specificity domain [Alkaliphilus metalliredigens QYMF]
MVTYPGEIIEYSEIKNIYKRVKGTPITAEKMHKIKSATGTIRVFAGGATEIKANVSDLPNANIINVPVVIVQSRGVIDFIYCNEPCTFKNEMWGYTSAGAYEVKFLFYYLKHNVDYFRNAGDGRSSFSQISLPVTEEYKIPLIPSNEQQAIASVLSDFDEHITNLTELIEKKKAIRDGALEDLVSGRTRLDGFDGEWVNVKLSDFAQINPSSPLPESFKYVDLESVKGISLVNWRVESKETAPSRAKRLAQHGDIFFQTVRPYQRNNYLYELPDKDFVFSTGYAQIRTENNAGFLFLLLRQDVFVNEVIDNCTGTSYPAINPSKLADINIYVPVDICEQQAIASILTSMDEEIESLETEKSKMIQIREGAMDELLTGRVRLKI